LSDPVPALKEMHRVLKRGGHVLILAEPDYSSRIDEPPELQSLGQLQTLSLQKQGASPVMGRKTAFASKTCRVQLNSVWLLWISTAG